MVASKIKFIIFTGAAAVALSASLQPAQATNGQLPACIGTYKCGMGGAGMTIASDPTAAAVNPALAARMGNEAILSVGVFKADVERSLTGTFANTTGGRQKSKADTFANGSLGVNYRLDDKKAVNISLYPGAGGSTNWLNARTGAGVGGGATDGTDTNITYRMFNLQSAFAYTPNPSTAVGAGVVLSRQTMKTNSLDNTFGRDENLGKTQTSYGIGFQFGAVHDINDKLTVAVDVHTKIWHQEFAGLKSVFNSAVDRPATLAAGTDYKISPETQVALDVKFVLENGVKTIETEPAAEGGFGWKNIPILMLGVQHKVTNDLQVRAGYNYGKSPIDSEHVFANVLYPAIVEHHFTGGLNYAVTDSMEFGWSAYWTPRAKKIDSGQGDSFSSSNAGSTLWHQQYGTQVSLKYKF